MRCLPGSALRLFVRSVRGLEPGQLRLAGALSSARVRALRSEDHQKLPPQKEVAFAVWPVLLLVQDVADVTARAQENLRAREA
ncbi:protein of unknown function [Candidatus Filomicrobium marinum]|uniref:Uncharacterized protein n=1 Tax=Candidatus Filomicrobium marinum TaxID=1608628 RepID=A0A0D6JBX2_9HYPH|nr:protein of unknown function [Candidatus Filomicrobium marinum]CPR16775.1 protein of unknown function [Candidatus Filomicrobium marinum]